MNQIVVPNQRSVLRGADISVCSMDARQRQVALANVEAARWARGVTDEVGGSNRDWARGQFQEAPPQRA